MLSKNKIKFIHSLHQKKGRETENLFIAEGVKIVDDLLNSSFSVQTILATAEWIESKSGRKNLPGEIIEITYEELKKVSSLTTPNEVLALARIPENPINNNELQNNLTLVLDDIRDPGNLGTIIRLADWFGILRTVCSPGTVDAYNPKVVQATMGAIFRVRILYADLEILFKENLQPVYGTFLDGENIYDAKLGSKGFVVMGNEAHGISENLLPYISNKLYIPNFPPNRIASESLNVSVATAIVCSEFRRRK